MGNELPATKKRPLIANGELRDRNTIRMVAEYWAVSPDTVRRQIENGKLNALRIGGVIRVTREQVEAYGEGNWSDYRSSQTGVIAGSHIAVGPVFRGEVYPQTVGNWSGWRASLNGEALAGYPTMAGAKARVDWEIWNRLRQVRESYEVLMARKAEWQDGGNAYRSPEYFGAEVLEVKANGHSRT